MEKSPFRLRPLPVGKEPEAPRPGDPVQIVTAADKTKSPNAESETEVVGRHQKSNSSRRKGFRLFRRLIGFGSTSARPMRPGIKRLDSVRAMRPIQPYQLR